MYSNLISDKAISNEKLVKLGATQLKTFDKITYNQLLYLGLARGSKERRVIPMAQQSVPVQQSVPEGRRAGAPNRGSGPSVILSNSISRI